jgi:LDH2 family malate/lactate/ureidoglycolate dehydrogenase
VRRKADCNEIFVPGEIEWNTQNKRSRQGIPLSQKTIEQLNAFAEQIGCRPLKA